MTPAETSKGHSEITSATVPAVTVSESGWIHAIYGGSIVFPGKPSRIDVPSFLHPVFDKERLETRVLL